MYLVNKKKTDWVAKISGTIAVWLLLTVLGSAVYAFVANIEDLLALLAKAISTVPPWIAVIALVAAIWATIAGE